jgi:hypothetical protein
MEADDEAKEGIYDIKRVFGSAGWQTKDQG